MDQSFLDIIYKHRYRTTLNMRLYLAFLAVLLATSPITINHTGFFMAKSNIVGGGLLLILAAFSLKNLLFFRLSTIIGLWEILIACIPEQSSLAVFANNTLVGLSIVCLTCIFPSRPSHLEVGPTLPEGFSYNPSSENRRNVMFFFSSITWFIVRDLVTQSFYTSPNHAGFLTCIRAALFTTSSWLLALSLSGSKRRWHTRPILVINSFLIVIFALLQVFLAVILQCIPVHNWKCLSLTLSLAIIVIFNIDELQATLRHLFQTAKQDNQLKIYRALQGSTYYQESFLWEECSHSSLSKACKQLTAGIYCPLSHLLSIAFAIVLLQINNLVPFSSAYTYFINTTCWLFILFSTIAFSYLAKRLIYGALFYSVAIVLSPLLFRIPIGASSFFFAISIGVLLVIFTLMTTYCRKNK